MCNQNLEIICCKKKKRKKRNYRVSNIADVITEDATRVLNAADNERVKKWGKIIAIYDTSCNIACFVIAKEATDVEVVSENNIGKVKYRVGDKTYQKKKSNPSFDVNSLPHSHWTVIPLFSFFGCVDLAFYATILEREDLSATKCPYCSLSSNQWKEIPYIQYQNITIDLIKEITQLVNKTNGVKCSLSGMK